MLKYFIKKHKEDFLLCMGALTTGVLSFFVTLNFYQPGIKDEQVENEFYVAQTSVNSVVNKEIEEEIAKIESEKSPVSVEVSDVILVSEAEIPSEFIGNMLQEVKEQEIVNTISKDILIEPVEIKEKTEVANDKITEAFAFKKTKNFDWPLSGDIIKDFALDSLLYSKTLDEWCTHEGIDISGNEGDVIVAVEDGIVERIFEDEKYGKTIIISHENGYETFYSFVNPANLAKEKQKVRKGEAIGRLTVSTNFEAKDAVHLHFEMLKNGKKVDPISEILKK